jgi:zinc transport system substrate-binding protein
VRALLSLLCVVACAAAVGCGPGAADPHAVVASFYPLAWAAERVAPAGTSVVDLTPPGVEPHDLELSPHDVQAVQRARLVLYLGSGFQPSVQDAVATRSGPSVDVLEKGEGFHIWLDPVRFRRTVTQIASALGEPDGARPAARDLRRLDLQYRRGLARCDRRVFITTHAAFDQLAARYGLTALSIGGRSPESEPGPRGLERIVDDVRRSGATTIFTEPLVSSRLAETVAREAHVRVATLDPVEGLSEARTAAGADYLTIMRANLAALRTALGCR